MTAQEALTKAVKLGLITSDQVKTMVAKYKDRDDEIMEVLEQMISEQMSPGKQCVGDHCSI